MGRRSAPMRSSPAPSRNLPAAAPAPPPPAAYAQQPKQPGMFAQMASMAGGVAVGSAIGHTVGAVVTSAFTGGSSNQPAQQQQQAPAQQSYQQPPQQQQQQYNQNPCFEQFNQFLECTQKSSDISMCQGFNEALKDCKMRYGM